MKVRVEFQDGLKRTYYPSSLRRTDPTPTSPLSSMSSASDSSASSLLKDPSIDRLLSLLALRLVDLQADSSTLDYEGEIHKRMVRFTFRMPKGE